MHKIINCLLFSGSLFFTSATFAASGNTSSNETQRAFLGKPQPSFSLSDIQGTIWTDKSWPGKVLVVNFWASWCTPCRKEIPMFNRLQKDYTPDDVQFIGIAIDNTSAIKSFVAKIPITYPVLIGDLDAVKLSRQFGNLQDVLPYTVFIDKQGRIAVIASGGLTEEYTRRAIEKLL